MSTVPYWSKLLDPRWQRKRLEILERDEFRCRSCTCDDQTLHVHHRYYTKGLDPWDYPSNSLVTVCHSCHEWLSSIEALLVVSFDPSEASDVVQLSYALQRAFATATPLLDCIKAIHAAIDHVPNPKGVLNVR